MTDDVLIKSIFVKNKPRYGLSLTDGEAFEFFCAETALKSYGLTFDQIEKGILDGQNDGGIDCAYFFINRSLISIDTEIDIFKSPVTIDLYIIQSKLERGFSETAISKLIASLPELIRLDAKQERLETIFNDSICEFFESYRNSLTGLATEFPSVNAHIIYANLSTTANSKVEAMLPMLVSAIESHHPKCKCSVELWGASRLYQEAQKQNTSIRQLPYVKQPISHGKGYIILTTLEDYFQFVNDVDHIADSLFEFNVRDYQSGAAVNKEIAATLASNEDQADFWWLNNGVTILAEEAVAQDSKLTIKNPIVVNGLQTSHEIHRFFADGGKDDGARSVQVRVLQIDDEHRRDRVIKATNSQTGIKPASLYATEPIMRKIEDFLLQKGIFYDRRKDFWRNKGKPSDKIISIDKLAQSVMSILLERPHDARARPTTIMKEAGVYQDLFSETNRLEIYSVCADIYFLVDNYFKQEEPHLDAVYRNNLRYHLMMQIAWSLNGVRPINVHSLSKIKASVIENNDIARILSHTMSLFDAGGKTDRYAKSEEFTGAIKASALVKTSKMSKK